MKTDYTTYAFSIPEKIRILAEAVFAALLAAYLFYDHVFAVFPLLCFTPLWFRIRRKQRIRKRQAMLRDGLRELLNALLFSFRAGRSAETAFAEAGKSLPDVLGGSHPLCMEWNALTKRLRLGESPEMLLSDLASRSGIEELMDLASVFAAAKRSGGNMADLMEAAAKRLNDAIDTQREIETAFAAKKSEHRVMSLMPGGIILYMRLGSPGYLDSLYRTLPGVLIMTFCLLLYAAAILWGERITQIDL